MSTWRGERDRSSTSAPHDPAASAAQPNFFGEDPTIKTRKAFSAPPQVAAAVPVEERAAALEVIREDLGDCTRCALHKGRNTIVFGVGNPAARLMFVGEGPGADEDAQGLPFVGRAGQLLNNMIAAMGLKREECLHRQRGQVPAAGQSHAGARRSQHLLAVSLSPD